MTRILLLLPLTCLLAAGEDDTKHPYGFRGFELYKFEYGLSGLTVCDADGDGLKDLLVINNRRAKIEVMLRRKDPVPPKTKTGEPLPNDLVDDRFFERKEILTEKKVEALAAADLNGDGKLDVAYYGKPEELVVAFGDGKGGFGKTTAFALEDYKASGNGLAAGDLNGDGRADLALLAKGHTSIYFQTDKYALAEPVKVPHAVKGVSGLGIVDLNGDERPDLLHVVPASPRSLRVRFQAKDGSLGAEIAYETSPWRVMDFSDISPEPGAEVLVIQRTSGILRSLRLTAEKCGGAVPLGTVEMHAFETARGRMARSMAIGDVNGDKRLDIVVTEPGTAQVAVYLQAADGTLLGRKTFPSLSDSSAVRVADLDGDGRAEVIVLSSGERAVGVSSLKDGRLPFPELLPMDGAVPKTMDVGDLDGDGKPELVIAVEKEKRRSVLVLGKAGSEVKRVLALKELRNAPDDMMIMDLDQNGKADLLLFDRFGSMRVWMEGGQKLLKIDQVQKLARGNVGVADLDGDGKPELLITSKNFARAVVHDARKGLRIKDQANGRSPGSVIKGVVALDVDGDQQPDVALFDKEKNMVSVLKRGEGGVFEVAANLSVGEIDYQALFAEDVNGDGRRDIVVFGKNRFGVLYAGGQKHKLDGLHSIESSVRDVALETFAVGDLNGDGKPDLAVLDAGNRGVQVFSYDPQKGFGEKLHWPIYQKKMHEERRRRGGAREIVIADLDGDGLNDIALIVHDRVVVYPQ